MAAHAYPPMMELVRSGALRPDLLVTSTIPLDGAPAALAAMGTAPGPGITIIRPGAAGGTEPDGRAAGRAGVVVRERHGYIP